MDFSGDVVAAIETALEKQRPGGWRRVAAGDLALSRTQGLRAGWQLKLPAGQVLCAGVDHLIVVLDQAFPSSQPRVFAPQADRDYSWPHVESGGKLCLPATRLDANADDRILQHLAWACDLLNLSKVQRRDEFAREFATYWLHRASGKEPLIVSLAKPEAPSREIVYFEDSHQIILGENAASLISWLRNTNRNPREKQIARTWLWWRDAPPIPNEFPNTGEDILRHIPTEQRDRILRPGTPLPILIGARTESGPALAAVLLQSAPAKQLKKGFRNITRVPRMLIERSFGSRPVQRCVVTRADGRWVHGRDHDDNYDTLASKSVVVVGCGALGSAIARMLAQAGVGNFRLIDDDVLSSPNTARHVLGHPCVGKNKANAMAQMLRSDFPHIRSAESYPELFERLTQKERESLVSNDLVISAGLDYSSDVWLDSWRRECTAPPPHLCTWFEEFALVGHAVAIVGADTLVDGFDKEGRPRFRLTGWPPESTALITEAGCGNMFQPHGVVDMQPTVALAARMALDILLGVNMASRRSVWQGSRASVVEQGGTPAADFKESFVVKDFPWRFD